MKFDLTLGLVDRPGQLIKALEPIAKNGGNIISILHDREEVTIGNVPVSLVVDFPATRNYEKAKEELVLVGISIIKSEQIIEKSNITFILIGRLDIKKIAEIEIEGVRITDLEVSTPTSKEACVRFDIEAPIKVVNKAVSKMRQIAREEKAILISSL
jgi:ACT domain-containing protein